jgi:predicted ATPase/class 3 adenylate cyclase
MSERVLCPTLIGRQDQLFILEDALLTAHRGESRFVALGGEAGMGKTRLATELAARAQRLDWEVLWGACSEAEFSLPYLPLVEAVGNYLSRQDTDRLADQLGAARRELAQLFPLLGRDEPDAPVGDPTQAKLRLFEAVVGLLSLPARERGLLLIVEDVHWADAATRELLDHIARRLTNTRSLVLVTYRSDELDRRHPLAPLLQTWRRSRVAELVTLSPLGETEIAEMIAAILDHDEIGPEFRDLMLARTEGNPFVLEEMLREAIDRGDVFRTADGWDRRALTEVRIPETVRDTILLRFARLDPAEAEILQAAGVLGRTFDYATLVAVANAPDATVQSALAVGVAQQLIEELAGAQAIYRWRHALTQEAIADEIVLPRRQEIHSRAADVLSASGASALQVARHLLHAGRFSDAVPACFQAAEEAEASLAFAEALEVLEHALPHVKDPVERARLLCHMGRLLWTDGKTAAAAAVLSEGIPALVSAGEELEAARYRLVLARAIWEQSKPEEAEMEFEEARRVLEKAGPSAELSIAYMRISGLYKFNFDAERSLELAEKAVEVAEAAGADFERLWAQAWVAFALYDVGRTAEAGRTLDQAFEEAQRRDYTFITNNIVYNDAWTRLHTMTAGVDDRLGQIVEGGPEVMTNMLGTAKSWGLRARGNLTGALAAVERADASTAGTGSEKVRWRTRVELAEVLLELGRSDEASPHLPALSERAELQDIIYDAGVQIRLRLATGRLAEAVEVAREIAGQAERFVPYWDGIAVAAEALVSAGLLEEVETMVLAARSRQTDVGVAFLDEAEGRLRLAQGNVAEAERLLTSVANEAVAREFRLVEWRVRALLAEARRSETDLAAVIAEADAANAVLIRDTARDIARRLGFEIPELQPPATDGMEPELTQAGERLVTMLFADVRGYTALSSTTAPADLTERIGTLHRWAAAEVGRHHGFVDKFAGDAVMATFNASGTRIDHAREALAAALALSGKAAFLDLGVGIGIAVGPAVVGRTVAGANVSVLGPTTNLAARLQTAAEAGEIVLSEEAHRRVAPWLEERGLEAVPQTLELKGFDDPQPAFRLRRGYDPVTSATDRS